MRTTIDKAGRVVIPKEIRDQLELRAGTELEVLADADGVRLVRRAPAPKLVRVRGRLVVRATAPASERAIVDVAALIDEERDRWPR